MGLHLSTMLDDHIRGRLVDLPTKLLGVRLLEGRKHIDERGFFAEVFSTAALYDVGLDMTVAQANVSHSAKAGTLRGMHYQVAPKAQAKLVRCLHGAIYDVVLDLRPESKSLGRSFGAQLTAENYLAMYVPKGFAHGFITLTDNTEVLYCVDEVYSPDHERVVRHDDE